MRRKPWSKMVSAAVHLNPTGHGCRAFRRCSCLATRNRSALPCTATSAPVASSEDIQFPNSQPAQPPYPSYPGIMPSSSPRPAGPMPDYPGQASSLPQQQMPQPPPPGGIPDNATYSTQPGPPRRTSRAQEQLRQLTAARQESLAAMQQARSTYNMGAAQAVDVRMYEQAVNARNRLSKKLSDTNMYCDNLEERLLQSNQHLMETQEFLKELLSRMIEMRRLADSLHISVKYSSDKETCLNRVKYLQHHLANLDEELESHLQVFKDIVPRSVPVTWQGVASEVRVMGEFDNWTRGVLLSGDDVTDDNVVAIFKGELLLKPGKYLIKFLVDGEWRPAPDWPMETDQHGEANNVVIVR